MVQAYPSYGENTCKAEEEPMEILDSEKEEEPNKSAVPVAERKIFKKMLEKHETY
jgi:hypothetical protein